MSYEKGKLHGQVRLYWPNGKLKRESLFIQGVKKGADRIWDEEGGLLDESLS